jgi:hypothetical protein
MKSILSLLFILNFLSSVNGQNLASDSTKVAVVKNSNAIVKTGYDTIYMGTSKYATTIEIISSTEISFINNGQTITVNRFNVDSVFMSKNTLSMVSTTNKHFGRHLKNVANLQIVTMLLPFAAILLPKAALPIGVAAIVLTMIQIDELRKAGIQAIKQDQTEGSMFYPNGKNARIYFPKRK